MFNLKGDHNQSEDNINKLQHFKLQTNIDLTLEIRKQ